MIRIYLRWIVTACISHTFAEFMEQEVTAPEYHGHLAYLSAWWS